MTYRRRNTRKPPNTKTAERRAQFAALRAQLDEYAAQLTDQERAMIYARFAGYSERNAMLIAMQCPTATEVHGYGDWQKARRQVRKGEQGIRITAYRGGGDEVDDSQAEAGQAETKQTSRARFGMATVFDIAQTDPFETAEWTEPLTAEELDAIEAGAGNGVSPPTHDVRRERKHQR